MSPPTPPSPATPPTASARPEYVPESHWDAGAGKVKDEKALATHFNEIIARDAAAQSQRLALPQKADDYKVELPADFKAPEGIKVEFKADDPLMAQAKAWAHKRGLSQETFAEGLALFAGAKVADQQQVTAARNAEVAKLGATGPARIDALTTFFKSYLGDGEGAQVMSRVFTASDVQIMEKLVGRITQNGSFRQNGREPPQPAGTKTPEQIAKMSPAERLDYNRQFDQSKMPAWRDPRAA